MRSTRLSLAISLPLIPLLAVLAPPAGASAAKGKPQAERVGVGQPVIGESGNGLASILVPVRYPIELAGRVAELRVALIATRRRPSMS